MLDTPCSEIGTGFPLHSPVSPSLPLTCVTLCHQPGRQFSRLLAAELCASEVVMLDTPCSDVGTSFPLHLPVSPSLPLPCVTSCHQPGRQFSRLLAAELCASEVVMLDTPCSDVGTGFPLHSPVSPSLPLTCVTMCLQLGLQFSRLLAAELCASEVVMLDTPCSDVGTGFPLRSPVSPSLPLPCVTMCRHISTGVYHAEDHFASLRHVKCSCIGNRKLTCLTYRYQKNRSIEANV